MEFKQEHNLTAAKAEQKPKLKTETRSCSWQWPETLCALCTVQIWCNRYSRRHMDTTSL